MLEQCCLKAKHFRWRTSKELHNKDKSTSSVQQWSLTKKRFSRMAKSKQHIGPFCQKLYQLSRDISKRGNLKKRLKHISKEPHNQVHIGLIWGGWCSLGWHTSWPTTLYQVHSKNCQRQVILWNSHGTWLAVVLQPLHRWVWGHQDQPGKKKHPKMHCPPVDGSEWFRNSGDHHLWWC